MHEWRVLNLVEAYVIENPAKDVGNTKQFVRTDEGENFCIYFAVISKVKLLDTTGCLYNSFAFADQLLNLGRVMACPDRSDDLVPPPLLSMIWILTRPLSLGF